MTFRRPSVIVYQELLSTTPSLDTPFFDLCIVGPAYQVQSGVKASDYVLSNTDYTSKYIDQQLGSVIDQSSLVVNASDVYVKIWPVADETLSSGITVSNDTTVTTVVGTEDLPFSAAAIATGDTLVITYKKDGEPDVEYNSIILNISEDAKTLTLKRNIPSPDEGYVATGLVKRANGDDIVIASDAITTSTDGFTIAAKTKIVSSVTALPVELASATIKVDYRALRKDIANDFVEISSQSVSKAKLGSTNIQNPLSVASALVFSTAAITFSVLPIESDDSAGYLKALDILSTSDKFAVIVPLTQEKAVISAFASHCKNMSTPEKSKWRFMYGNEVIPSTKVMVELNAGQLAPHTVAGKCYLKDVANGMFITNGVRVTDFLDVYTNATTPVYQYSLQVLDVLNDTVAELSTEKWTRTSEGYAQNAVVETVDVTSAQDCKYEVVRVLDTAGMCDTLCTMAKAYSNKRLRLVEPDTCMITLSSTTYTVGGEYLCVVLGAMRAGFPPHQGLSTMGISGIDRILRSNKLFTDDQLDLMAGSGVFWIIQDDVAALPYVLYQTTTDTTQLETAEDSIVAVIDYASKFYKTNLRSVLGKYNVNTISTNYVKTIVNSVSDTLVGTTYSYIGPILTSASLVSVTTSGDKIVPTIHIEVPFPVNGVDVHLTV